MIHRAAVVATRCEPVGEVVLVVDVDEADQLFPDGAAFVD
jgi:hypothetical protein